VPDRDLGALIEAAGRCVRESELRARLGDQARCRVRDTFSPAASLRKLVDIYDEVAGA
jgi:glycosyltransferase involved in cell wall biosynthesis